MKRMRKIGSGRNREVYELSNHSVLKIAFSKKGIENNKTEVKIYKYASKKIRKHLGRIKKYDSKYRWIQMKKYKLNFRKTKMNLRRLQKLKKGFRKHGIKALDILTKDNKVHRRNLAIVNKKRIVVICRTTRTFIQRKSLKQRLFYFFIEVLVVSSRQELLYNAVLGQELIYSPVIPRNENFIKIPRNDSISSLRLMNSQDFTL